MSSDWGLKGATLSDKTAIKEYGLTQNEIYEAMRAEKLQYREMSLYGNPFFRLLRREVETLVRKKHGGKHLNEQKVKTELAHINYELRQLKNKAAMLEARRFKLTTRIGKNS